LERLAEEKGFQASRRLWLYVYEANHPRFYVTTMTEGYKDIVDTIYDTYNKC
jgi:hypothetical protein